MSDKGNKGIQEADDLAWGNKSLKHHETLSEAMNKPSGTFFMTTTPGARCKSPEG